MSIVITYLQIITSLFLTVLILLQVKGVGFGRVWGSSMTSFSRRGLEGFVFKATFFFVFLFMVLSILQLVV